MRLKFVIVQWLLYTFAGSFALFFAYILSSHFFPDCPPPKLLSYPRTSSQPSPPDPITSILNQYSISPEPCSPKAHYFVVLICFSRPKSFAQREAIRQTWGTWMDPACGVRLLFMLGGVLDEVMQKSLEQEAKQFGDIIQSNQFVDDFRSASIKALHLLQWGITFCGKSWYIAKGDDDNYVNVPKWLAFIGNYSRENDVLGYLIPAGALVWRGMDDMIKYFASREEYPEDVYPEYLSGILYAIPTAVIPMLLEASKEVPRTFNDDVYVTGMLVDAVNLSRGHMPDVAHDTTIENTNCPKCDKMCIHYSEVEDLRRTWADLCCPYRHLC